MFRLDGRWVMGACACLVPYLRRTGISHFELINRRGYFILVLVHQMIMLVSLLVTKQHVFVQRARICKLFMMFMLVPWSPSSTSSSSSLIMRGAALVHRAWTIFAHPKFVYWILWQYLLRRTIWSHNIYLAINGPIMCYEWRGIYGKVRYFGLADKRCVRKFWVLLRERARANCG